MQDDMDRSRNGQDYIPVMGSAFLQSRILLPQVEEWDPQVRSSPKGSCTQQKTRQEKEGIPWMTEEGFAMKS